MSELVHKTDRQVFEDHDRFEDALQRIATHATWYTEHGTTRRCDQSCMDQVIAIAREALDGAMQPERELDRTGAVFPNTETG